MTPADGEEASENEWRTAVEGAMQGAKAAGRLPADMERTLRDWLTIKRPWKEILADFVRARSGFDTRNMRRLNKRRLYQNRVCIPTRFGWQIEKIAFIFDVSGSISNEEVAMFMGTVKDILEQCPAKELRCVCVNTEPLLDTDKVFNSLDEFMDYKPHGSGGTDMEAGFRFYEEEGYEPDLCLVLTDGYTSTDAGNEPSFPVIWTTTGQVEFAYGNVVHMDLSETDRRSQ